MLQRGVSSKVGGVVSPQRAKVGEMVLLQRAASSKVGGMVFASARCILQGWRDGVCPRRLRGWMDGFCLSAASPPRLEGLFLLQRAEIGRTLWPQRGTSSKVGGVGLLQRGVTSSRVGGMVFASARRPLRGWRDGVCLSAVPPPRLEGWRLLHRGASSKVGGIVFASAGRLLQDWMGGSYFSAHDSEGRFGRSAATPPRLEGCFVCFSAACPPRLDGWFRLSEQISEIWFCFSAPPPPRLEGRCLPQHGASSKVGGMVFASARRLLQGWRDVFFLSIASHPRLEGWFLLQRA